MTVSPVEISPRTITFFAAVGAGGLLLTFVRVVSDPRAGLLAYLIGFAYWLSLALGALLLLAIFHASKAKWPIVFRRKLEVMSLTTVVLALLFVPIALGAHHLFSWVRPAPELTEPVRHLLESKRAYLNVPFFMVRAVIYFSLWIGVSFLLHRWSTRQDAGDELAMLWRQEKLGAGSLPPLAICLTFAAFDWLMSLDATWYSTIFGVYYFSGGFLGAIALLIVISVLNPADHQVASIEHFHNLGKLMLAFVCFWAYIAFSQLMLIWIGNLPEEITWYLARIRGPWRPVAFVLGIGHFFLPFFVLLSRDIKRVPRRLAWVAVWILVIHYVDLLWVIAPALRPTPRLEWSDLTALIGIGGVTIAFGLWLIRGKFPIPIRDPHLPKSLKFVQP